MANDSSKLADFLREVSNWNWEEFCRAEHDPQYTSNEAMIFGLIRACVMEKMEAIKLAMNRIDGKLKTPVRIELPKVFYRYPRATLGPDIKINEDVKRLQSGGHLSSPVDKPVEEILQNEQPETGSVMGEVIEPDEPDLATLSLRQTLARMSDTPREVPQYIIEFATLTQQWLKGNAEEPEEKPLVKSVVAAHLLKLAQERNIDALAEVFDQIDGKLVETIQVLGEDIFITDYSLTAPDGAYLGPDGVLRLEASQAQDTWAAKLGNKNG